MENIVRQIIIEHKNLFKENPQIEKINAGFTNTLFAVDGKYIIKICKDAENEAEFQVEIDFYKEFGHKNYVSKMFAYSADKAKIPFYYIILEKLQIPTLYGVWHTFSEPKREEIVAQICGILRDFHKKSGEKFDWSAKFKGYYNELIEVLPGEEVRLAKKVMKKFDAVLSGGEFAYIHNDLHFGNIFYDGENIKLIDFESSRYNPIDKELEILYFMSEMPYLLADAENEKFVKAEDYKNIMSYFKKYYPEMFDVPNLEKRLAVYHLQDSLEQFLIYKNEKWLRERILRLANEITSPD